MMRLGGKGLNYMRKNLLKFLEFLHRVPRTFALRTATILLVHLFYGKAEENKTITKEENYTAGQEIRVSNMEASDRLLLNVISHIVFNKSRNLACGSESKFFTMASFMQGQAINIPYMMMRRMEACVRKKSPLPYAAFISKILRAFGVNPHFHYREDFFIIDSNSLRRMNFLIGTNGGGLVKI